MIAYTIDTSDPEKEADHLRFSTEILPKMEERSVELARRLVESGYATPELATTLARFRTAIEIFREANVPIFAELEELSARYQRITGSMTVEWEGQERPLPQLQPFLKSPDRAVRERAFRAAARPTSSSAATAGGAVRPDVRAAPAGGAERRLRQFPGLHLPGQVPLRLHPGGLRALPRRGRAHGGPRGGADAGDPPESGSGSTPSVPGTWPWIPTAERRSVPSATSEEFVGRARAGLRAGGPGARQRVPDHDRRGAARPGQPEGQGAGRLLRDAALTGDGRSSS